MEKRWIKIVVIQIFGKKSCNNSKKAERFFKERGVKYQFINILEKAPSKGELNSIKTKYDIEELLDVEGTEYTKRNLKYMVYDTEELLLENPILFKTPIIRKGNQITMGYDPKTWEDMLEKGAKK
ncbi:MAG: arsenate reductase family protein [Fusobacteriaceae bacterium]